MGTKFSTLGDFNGIYRLPWKQLMMKCLKLPRISYKVGLVKKEIKLSGSIPKCCRFNLECLYSKEALCMGAQLN